MLAQLASAHSLPTGMFVNTDDPNAATARVSIELRNCGTGEQRYSIVFNGDSQAARRLLEDILAGRIAPIVAFPEEQRPFLRIITSD